MESRSSLFDDIVSAVDDIFDQENCKMSMDEVKDTIKQYSVLLGLFSTIFSTLRKILPTDQELQTLELTQEAAQKLWIHLKISRTHKLHLITDGHSLNKLQA